MFKTVSIENDLMWLSTPASYDKESETNDSVKQYQHMSNSSSSASHAIINPEDYRTASIVVECGILPSLGLLGIPANILSMVVFYRQGLQYKMNLCLFALAFADFMFVTLLFSSFHCPAVLFPDSLLVQVLKWNMLKFTLNFRYAFWYSSAVITAIIATERCICVVWPVKSATILKTKIMAGLIFGIIVIINLLCLPYALKHAVRMKTDNNGNVTVILDDTDLYVNNKFPFLIIRDGILSSLGFITFFVVSFVTVVTVRKLKTAMDWRQKTSSNVMDKRQMTLVKILITVSCVYITCNVPSLSLAAVRFFVDDFSTLGKYRNLFFITHRGGLGPLMLNSSVNVFIYYRQSSRFRKELQACVSCFKDPVGEKSST